jgi:phage FluMu gp28-like protein
LNSPEPEVIVEYKRPFLYRKQLEAIFEPKDVNGDPARYSFIEAATKTGKTIGCVAWLFEQAMLHGKPGQNYWWVAPVYPQAAIAYDRMKRAAPEGTFRTNDGDLKLQVIDTGAMIWFKSGEKPDNLYGEDVYAAVLDEASRMRPEAWYAVRSTITATDGHIRFIGNVKGRHNWFYALARKAETGERGMSYHKIVAADAVAAGVLADEQIRNAKAELPDNVFRELYLAEPSDDGGNPFGLAAIGKCLAPLARGPVVAWGWDLAKSRDWTVGIGLNAEGNVSEFHRFQKPWDDTLEYILRTARAPSLVDSTGVGDPIVEMLQKRTSEQRFEGYVFSQSSKQRLMEGLAVAIQSEKITFPDGPIRTELEVFEYEYTRIGVRYSAPEDMGYHDDCVCALALAVMRHATARPSIKVPVNLLAAVQARGAHQPGRVVRMRLT